jgi:hypothetical protein
MTADSPIPGGATGGGATGGGATGGGATGGGATGGGATGGGATPGGAAAMTDRRGECAVLSRFVDGVRAGEGRALVVRGEPGVGKTVLLDYLAGLAAGCRVARVAGV